MKSRVDRTGPYLCEGVLEASDRREDFRDTQKNIGSTDDPDINGCGVREPSRIQACCVSVRYPAPVGLKVKVNIPLG